MKANYRAALSAAVADYKAAKQNPYAAHTYFRYIVKQVCRLGRAGFAVSVVRKTSQGHEYRTESLT